MGLEQAFQDMIIMPFDYAQVKLNLLRIVGRKMLRTLGEELMHLSQGVFLFHQGLWFPILCNRDASQQGWKVVANMCTLLHPTVSILL